MVALPEIQHRHSDLLRAGPLVLSFQSPQGNGVLYKDLRPRWAVAWRLGSGSDASILRAA